MAALDAESKRSARLRPDEIKRSINFTDHDFDLLPPPPHVAMVPPPTTLKGIPIAPPLPPTVNPATTPTRSPVSGVNKNPVKMMAVFGSFT